MFKFFVGYEEGGSLELIGEEKEPYSEQTSISNYIK